MVPTVPAVLFTVVFVVTGVVALVQYVRISAAPPSDPAAGGRAAAAELMHLLMSVAMIAMTWGWSGGPTTGSGIVQLVVFGAFTVLFLTLTTRARPTAVALGVGAHALTAAATVWMVAAMPVLMGHAMAADDDAHAGHGGYADTDTGAVPMAPMPAEDAPTWALVVNTVLAVLLVAAAGLWAARAVGALRGRTGAPPGARAPTATPGPAPEGAVRTLAPPATGRAAVGCADADHGVLAASCHTLMSLGMAAMLLLMA